jgi:hypothetical protein
VLALVGLAVALTYLAMPARPPTTTAGAGDRGAGVERPADDTELGDPHIPEVA